MKRTVGISISIDLCGLNCELVCVDCCIFNYCVGLLWYNIVCLSPEWRSVARVGIFKLLKSPVIDYKKSISPGYIGGSVRHNPILTRFLAPRDCSKIPALG
jgi:hypothetical protein